MEARVDAIQLREKDLNTRELVELGRRVAQIIREANSARSPKESTRFLINSRIDVAIACGADGVHLRSDDISAADARAVFVQAGVSHPHIGVSCHMADEIELAEGHGADFAVFGPIFEKSGGEDAALGIDSLRRACQGRKGQRHLMPVLALGGVTASNATECLKAGAMGIAGIRLFQSGNPAATIARLRALEPK